MKIIYFIFVLQLFYSYVLEINGYLKNSLISIKNKTGNEIDEINLTCIYILLLLLLLLLLLYKIIATILYITLKIIFK